MKKTLKTVLALTLALIFTFALCACGEGGNGGEQNEGTLYDVGTYTVTVPKGYYICEQNDIWGEKDENGDYPKSTTDIGLVKGGDSDFDAMVKPTIYIYLKDAATTDPEYTVSWYEDVEPVDGVTINGVACEAYYGDSIGYKYDIIFYPVNDTQIFQIQVPVAEDLGGESMKLEDSDVQAILNSIKLK